jgi:hypothetical protein
MESGVGEVYIEGVRGIAGTSLLPDFTPGEHDVICGRGRKAFNHIGNGNFRKLVESRLAEYSHVTTKLEKSYMLSEIVLEVRQKSPGGFVKRDTTNGHWYEVGDFLAREKTSQAFRDALHDIYKSSNKAKKKRRQAEQVEKPIQDQNSAPSISYKQLSNYARMHLGRDEPSQDSLLKALDAEISAQLTGKSSFQAHDSAPFHAYADERLF